MPNTVGTQVARSIDWVLCKTAAVTFNTIQHFNFVCALVRLKEHEAALELLGNVIDKASTGLFVWLENDTDLDPLRGYPRFVNLFEQSKARFSN